MGECAIFSSNCKIIKSYLLKSSTTFHYGTIPNLKFLTEIPLYIIVFVDFFTCKIVLISHLVYEMCPVKVRHNPYLKI